MTVREATVDHVIKQRLLSRFGVKMDNMPDNTIEHVSITYVVLFGLLICWDE